MTNFDIKVSINNKDYSQTELDYIYYNRTIHVLHELKALDTTITDQNDKELSNVDINYLEMDDAKKILINNKLKLGNDGLKKLYKDRLAFADKRWQNIVEKSSGNYNKKVARTHIKVSGINFFKLNKILLEVNKNPEINLKSSPDNFEVKDNEDHTGQSRIETIGMYGEPTAMDLKNQNVEPPEPINKTHPKRIIQEARLASNHSLINAYLMDQIRPTFSGMDILSATYFPSATPDELINGHAFYSAIEYSNLFRIIRKKWIRNNHN